MTQIKKLVELINEADSNYNFELSVGKIPKPRVEYEAEFLLKNGVIVPPCKVGDKLWLVLTEKGNNDWYIFEDIVEGFVRCDSHDFCFSLKTFGYIYIDRQTNNIDDGLYDGCAYFAKEQAEKVLAEKRADNG